MSVIADTTRDILEEHLTDADGQISFPIDTVLLANKLGIRISEVNYMEDDIRAVSYRKEDNGDVFIVINRKMNIADKRSVTAKEIARIIDLLDKSEPFSFINRGMWTGQDNYDFAMNVLMPGFAVRRYWAMGYSVRKMAKIFGVRNEVLEQRLLNLKLY